MPPGTRRQNSTGTWEKSCGIGFELRRTGRGLNRPKEEKQNKRRWKRRKKVMHGHANRLSKTHGPRGCGAREERSGEDDQELFDHHVAA